PSEIAQEIDTYDLGGADRDIGISGEVTVDLKREEYRSENKRASDVVTSIVVHGVHVDGQTVADDDLLEQAPKELGESFANPCVLEVRLSLELGDQVPGAFDRAGDQLGKIHDEEQKALVVALWWVAAPIHVGRIADGLERVERDPDRQNHAEKWRLERQASRVQEAAP